MICKGLPSLKLTNEPLKMSAWDTGFLVGWLMFWDYVSFRDGSITYMVFISACFSMVFSFFVIVSMMRVTKFMVPYSRKKKDILYIPTTRMIYDDA